MYIYTQMYANFLVKMAKFINVIMHGKFQIKKDFYSTAHFLA